MSRPSVQILFKKFFACTNIVTERVTIGMQAERPDIGVYIECPLMLFFLSDFNKTRFNTKPSLFWNVTQP
jgi:hypothetical protein